MTARRKPRWWSPGSALLAGLVLAGCGESVSTSPSPRAPASPMVVTRTGGIAGVHEQVEIAADGSARFTSRGHDATACTPNPAAVDRLRAMDLAAVAAAPLNRPWADGFEYLVTTATGRASARDGDTGLRADLLGAAAAVIDSCKASTIAPSS